MVTIKQSIFKLQHYRKKQIYFLYGGGGGDKTLTCKKVSIYKFQGINSAFRSIQQNSNQ